MSLMVTRGASASPRWLHPRAGSWDTTGSLWLHAGISGNTHKLSKWEGQLLAEEQPEEIWKKTKTTSGSSKKVEVKWRQVGIVPSELSDCRFRSNLRVQASSQVPVGTWERREKRLAEDQGHFLLQSKAPKEELQGGVAGLQIDPGQWQGWDLSFRR